MRLTLGMTGMDSDTETALKAAVTGANVLLEKKWQLLSESEATHVIVDMDSMYGPMSWLRLHAAGKRVIGLTSAARTQTDFHLLRPFDAGSVSRILEAMSADEAVEAPPLPGVAAKASTQAAPAAPAAPAPEPAAAAPATPPPATPKPVAPKPTARKAPSAAPTQPEPPVSPPPTPEVAATEPSPIAEEPVDTATPPPRDYRLDDWLEPGRLSGRHRYQPAGKEALLIDADKRQYHGPATLKPLAGHFDEALDTDDFVALDDAAWAKQSAAMGAAQPLSRLQWYGGLVTGKGTLLHGFDPNGSYKLGKWPQTEREFPKHFRLATTMMKGPATIDEISASSGVTRADVIDFLNANLASGFAELVLDAPPEPAETTRSSGLFGRLLGK